MKANLFADPYRGIKHRKYQQFWNDVETHDFINITITVDTFSSWVAISELFFANT